MVVPKFTPQTYIDINKELEEDDCKVRLVIPTQEQIDNWMRESFYEIDEWTD